MAINTLQREQLILLPRAEVFKFFGDAQNLEQLTPPWLHFGVQTPRPIQMRAGALISYRMRLHGLPVSWTTEIEQWQPPAMFVDRQLRGPYRLWHHTHTFEERGESTVMRDVVRFQLPLGPLGDVAHRLFVARDLKTIFDYRRDAVERLIA